MPPSCAAIPGRDRGSRLGNGALASGIAKKAQRGRFRDFIHLIRPDFCNSEDTSPNAGWSASFANADLLPGFTTAQHGVIDLHIVKFLIEGYAVIGRLSFNSI